MLNITQKGLALLLIPVCFELFFIVIIFFTVEHVASDLEKMEHSKDAIQDLNSAKNWAIMTCIWAMSDNLNQKRDPGRLDFLEKQFSQSKLVRMTDERFPELALLQDDVKDLTETVSQIVRTKKKEYASNGTYFFPREMIYTAFLDLQNISNRILDIEKKLADTEPEDLQRLRFVLIAILAGGVACSAAISFLLARYMTSDIIDRLVRLKNNAHRLAARESVPPSTSRGDELAALESILHDSSLSLMEIRERENAILDNAADVICSLDRKLRFTGANAATSRIWNYREDELLGKALASLLLSPDVAPSRAQFQLISEELGEGEIENRLRTRGGDVRDIVWSVKWSESEEQFFCVLHDVTDIRELQRMKQQFLAIASHDLRSPLASVSIILDRLLADQVDRLDEKPRRELTKTRETLSRLLDLVNELLELEKLETGKFVLATNCVSARDVCVLSCETLETMAARAGVSLLIPNNDFAVLGDEKRLVQAVMNLLSNAIKFSPKDSVVTLSLRKSFTGSGKSMIEIHVTDQGAGISDQDQSLIFEKFTQSENSSTTSVKGTGLGLAIVKAIALAHGGEVGVVSEPGKGSTFWLSLPEFADQEEEP